MIDITKLDKRKTYVCCEFGTSNISKVIKTLTARYAPSCKKVPSHIWVLLYNKSDKRWWVYESHLKAVKEYGLPSGVRSYPLDTLILAMPNVIMSSEMFDIKGLDRHLLELLIGQPYGTGDIEALMRAALFNRNGKQKDRKGIICSEYVAMVYPTICEWFDLPSWCITPAHWYEYLTTRDKKDIIINLEI